MALHTPERQANETQQQYRERQALSRQTVRLIVRGGADQMPWTAFVQHTNRDKKNRRESIAAIGRRQFLKLSKAAREFDKLRAA